MKERKKKSLSEDKYCKEINPPKEPEDGTLEGWANIILKGVLNWWDKMTVDERKQYLRGAYYCEDYINENCRKKWDELDEKSREFLTIGHMARL